MMYPIYHILKSSKWCLILLTQFGSSYAVFNFILLCFTLSVLTHLLILQIVLFFSTCDAVDFHYSLISEFQFRPHSGLEAELNQLFVRCKTFRLHGNMKQEDRRTAFETFKKEKSALLLSTDVCARGLDFPKVKCIIQYDSPGEATEYVHRYLNLSIFSFLFPFYPPSSFLHVQQYKPEFWLFSVHECSFN